MARRGKSQARRQGSHGTPVWAWLLLGLFVGALGYFGYQQYLAYKAPIQDSPLSPQPDTAKSPAEKSIEPPASGVDDAVLDTDYSFYDDLPKEETVDVEIDPESVATSTQATPEKTTDAAAIAKDSKPEVLTEPAKATAPDNTRYMLQAGSFERNADAEDLKARIALSGEPARVEEAEVNGKTMYRVRLGPYSAESASTAKSALATQGINADRIKIK
jgi:cell division protein FtsN